MIWLVVICSSYHKFLCYHFFYSSIGDAVIIVQEKIDEDISDTAPLSEGDERSENPTTSDDPYRNLQLGLVQTLIFKLSKNRV